MTPRIRRTPANPKPKATTKTRRLPAAIRETGEVLIARPLAQGAVAHRRRILGNTDEITGRNPIVGTVTSACRPPADTEPPDSYAEFSAGWADHTYHAVACPNCFPTTDREATP